MELTNEEMEVLNRATEILSKYAAKGSINRDSFKLFERMVVDAIDSDVCDKNGKRQTITSVPFTRLLLSYVIGYKKDETYSFLSTVDLLNMEYSDNELRFESFSKETKELFKTINEFTLAPVIITEVNGELKYLVNSSHIATPEYKSVSKAETVNSLYYSFLPLVFECILDQYEDGVISTHFTLKILKKSVSNNTLDNAHKFDFLNARNQLIWQSIEGGRYEFDEE